MSTTARRHPRSALRRQPPPQTRHQSRTVSRPARATATRPGRPGQRRVRRRGALMWAAALIVTAAAVTTALLSTRSGSLQASVARTAPAFTLTSTAGAKVSLASYRGRDVVLYFSEGVGCDACFYQMRELEQHAAELAQAGVTIVPIVMSPPSLVRQEMAAFGIRTPYLTDTTGAVSRAYGVLGKGMHAGLPGHGFILVDASGIERWYGEYPSMYLSTAGLISQVKAHLPR